METRKILGDTPIPYITPDDKEKAEERFKGLQVLVPTQAQGERAALIVHAWLDVLLYERGDDDGEKVVRLTDGLLPETPSEGYVPLEQLFQDVYGTMVEAEDAVPLINSFLERVRNQVDASEGEGVVLTDGMILVQDSEGYCLYFSSDAEDSSSV